jgi:uncharacterized lipoprotein YajG
MGFMKLLGVAALIALLAGCSSPQDKAAQAQESSYEAQEKVAKERLNLVNKYQQCVKEAADNQQKAAACESYLKAAEALK